MERLGELLELFDDTAELLYDEGLEPASGRSFADRKFQIEQLVERYELQLLPLIDEVGRELEADVRTAISERATHLGLGVFAVLQASGDSGRALMLLGKLGELARSTDANELALAAGRDTAGFLVLARCRHRLANGNLTARAELKELAKSGVDKAIAAEALEMFHAPQPIKSAPSLWTINGFGTGLYGSRERRSDGSAIKTLCISALFIPIFPLSSYRVVDHGDGAYGFMSKNRLSGFSRAYQKLLAVSLIALIGWCNVDSYLNSPERLARKALATADSMEEYEGILDQYANSGDAETIEAAGLGVMKLAAAKVHDPFALEHLDHALRVVKRYEQLPVRARSGASATFMLERLDSWQTSLGTDTEAAIAGGVTLLDAVARIIPRERQQEAEDRLRALKTTLARRLTETRPLASLDLLMEVGAHDDAGALLARIAESPSLLIAAEASASRWLQVAPATDAGRQLQTTLITARSQRDDADRQAAIASREPRALAAAARAFPTDHQVVSALAELDIAAGEPKRALERLLALGKPGWLIPSAQERLASAYASGNQLEEADAVLTELLAYRLPTFRKVASAYYTAATRFRETLMTRVDTGSAPGHVMSAVRGTDEAAAIAAFETWAAEETTNNAELGRLKVAYEAYVDVVPASLTLGMLKLRRANRARGDERDAMLAAAETVFLSIRDDAEGVPSYHLGLGQVYHRLGKSAEGDAELAGLIARGDPRLSLEVSSAYRELGQNKRAAEVAEKVFNETGGKDNENAAHMMSFIVDDLDDKQMWLERSNQKLPEVQTSLLQVRAHRANRDGKDQEAAKLYRQVAAYYDRTAKHNSVSANNAAIAYLQLYQVTGDRRQLSKARAGFESSLRLSPGDALVVSNLSGHCSFEGRLDVLSKWLPVEAIRLIGSDVDEVTRALAGGPLREALLERTRTNRIVNRGIELGEQARTLLPGYVSGWERELQRLALLRDTAGIAALGEQIARVALDTSEREESRAEWISGSSDGEYLEHMNQSIARLGKRLASAKKSRSKTAIGAAHMLLATALAARSAVQKDAATMSESIEHYRAASASWPELALEGSLADALLRAALLESASKAVVGKRLEASWRRLSVSSLLAVALGAPDADAFRQALASHPKVVEARRLLRETASLRPSLMMWSVGTLTGDAELTRRGAGVFDLADELAEAKVDAMLDPDADSERTYLGLLLGRGTVAAEK